jgi:hypothetical protein
MNDLVEGQGGRWITPGEAIRRLGQERTDRDHFRQFITELPFDAVSGRVRSDGFSVNGIPLNQGGPTVEITAFDLDSLRIYLAAEVRYECDNGETELRVKIVDLDPEGGFVKLHIQQRISKLDDLLDPVIQTEAGVLLFSQIRFDERLFLDTFPQASPYQSAKRGERSKPSTPAMTEEEIAISIRSCRATDMKNGWTQFRVSHGQQAAKKTVFENVWREVHHNRKRGRPKKKLPEPQ